MKRHIREGLGKSLRASLFILGSGLCLSALPVFAQTSNTAVPEFHVPVLEGTDPSSVDFDGRIIERDRSEKPVPEATSNSPSQNTDFDVSASSSRGPGSYGSQGGQISVPSFPSGSSSSSGSSSDSSGGGTDVNVSVNGVPIPSVFDDGSTASVPGSSSESLPGSNSSSNGSSDDDGGMDVDVNVSVIGKQMPGMPGIPSMPGSSSSGGGMPSVGMPGSSGGAGMPSAGLPDIGSSSGSSGSSSGSRSGSSGSSGSGNSGNGRSSGNGSMGDIGSSGGGAGGAGSRAGKRSVLDDRLDESFGVFDGMIIGERERAQSDANAAGSSVMGTGGASGDGEGDGDFGEAASVMVASGPINSTGGGMLPEGARARDGEFNNQNQETFAPPTDIPNGNNDDVVARQLREAAMHEPDPELREKLWDEYRKYTGLAQ